MAGLCFCFFALVLFFPFPSDQIGGGFLVCYFFSSLSLLLFLFFGCSDGMEREACVCDHGYERSDLCAEIIIIIITYTVALFGVLYLSDVDCAISETETLRVRNVVDATRCFFCFFGVHGCEPGRVSDGSRPALCQTLSIECRSFIFL